MEKGRVIAFAFLSVMLGSPSAFAAPILGSAGAFAVLGATTITNTGATTIVGDIGVNPGTAVTGQSSISRTGALHPADLSAQQAASDASAAYASLAALAFTQDLTGTDLGTIGVLTPGVYRFGSSAQLTGHLILDFLDDPSASFIFQIGSTLTTASGSSITVRNGRARSGVFFDVGSSATLGTETSFVGNILAQQSITMNTAATVCGRALALNGAVTMDANTVSNSCPSSDFGSIGFSSAGETPAPEPAAWSMLIAGFGFIGCMMRRSRSKPAFPKVRDREGWTSVRRATGSERVRQFLRSISIYHCENPSPTLP